MRYLRGHQSRKNTPQYREDENGCWIWLWSKNRKGYGVLRDGPQMGYAHKVYWERVNGPVPDGLQLDHLCRVRACVNPMHLEAVTGTLNQQRGAHSALTQADVDRIRERVREGERQKDILRDYPVNQSTISAIVTERTWKTNP